MSGGHDYYILDARSCVGNCALWWGKDRRGYCCNLDDAGLYTLEQALGERETDVPVHKDVARGLVVQHVRWDQLGRVVVFRGPKLGVYLGGLRARAEQDACPGCVRIREGKMEPTHDGSKGCESGSIASGGAKVHCSCDVCF